MYGESVLCLLLHVGESSNLTSVSGVEELLPHRLGVPSCSTSRRPSEKDNTCSLILSQTKSPLVFDEADL